MFLTSWWTCILSRRHYKIVPADVPAGLNTDCTYMYYTVVLLSKTKWIHFYLYVI